MSSRTATLMIVLMVSLALMGCPTDGGGGGNGNDGEGSGDGEGASEGEGGGDWAEDTTTFDVTYAANTTQVTEDALALVLASNQETFTYTLDAAAVQSAGLDLTVGRNLVLHGLALRRITSTETSGGEITVETEFVPLNEIITDGTIAWDYGVEFTAQKIRSVVGPDGIEVPTKAGESIDITLSYDGLEYHIQMTLEGDKSAVTITVTKGIGNNITASFVAAGTIERFRSTNTIEIQGGALRQLDCELSGLKGDLTLDLIVAGSGADFINYKPTLTLLKVPLLSAQFQYNSTSGYNSSSTLPCL